MDKNEALKVAQKYVKDVRKKYDLTGAILFGSFAKGTNSESSDIDLAIILDHTDDMIDLQIELMCMRDDDGLLIEPHPFNSKDFDPSNPLVSEIINNGIKLQL